MTQKNKTPIGKIIQWIMAVTGFLGLFGGLVGGSMAWGEFKAQQKEVNFDSSKQKNDHINHVEEVPNVVENYKAMQQNIEIAKQLDTSLIWVQGVAKNYIEGQRLDSINDIDAIASRARRDSLRQIDAKEIEQIKKDNQRIENAVQLILSNQQKILDTIN
jgi:hypothetical protein